MTLEEALDRAAIRNLLATYNVSGDRLRLDEFVDVFTPDAVFESTGLDRQGSYRCEGRAEIRRWMEDFAARPAPGDAPAAAPVGRMFMRHNITTSQVELTGPDTAAARTYFHVYTPAGPDHAGVYVDKLRKDGGRWRIAHRQIRTDWISPQSIVGGR